MFHRFHPPRALRPSRPLPAAWMTAAGAALVLSLAACGQMPAAPSPSAGGPVPAAAAAASTPVGQTKGRALAHTAESARDVVARGALVLPARVTGGAVYAGPLKDAPVMVRGRAPVVVFMHGSSGLGLKAIGEWQQWLAGLGIASFAPDSFALPDRLTYTSPIDKDTYEGIHALRLSEVVLALRAVQAAPWADPARLVLAGTSEGSVPVARYAGGEFAGRILFAWSCENNYFVRQHGTALPADKPVLNVISLSDPFFSRGNAWLGNPSATGHCGPALKDHKLASVVLIPGAPHTLINLPAARQPVEGFLRELLKP